MSRGINRSCVFVSISLQSSKLTCCTQSAYRKSSETRANYTLKSAEALYISTLINCES